MGLHTSHDCWHGAYSAFSRWRDHLAEVAGYRIIRPTIEDVIAGREEATRPYVDLHWDAFKPKNYDGEWDSPPGDDPLLYLIVHSDCDGVIHPEQGVHLARRLEQLLPNLDEDLSGRHIRSMREVTQQFIDGLKKAAAAGEDVDFH
jgi:hypothetical protein